ncbi:glycosyltransferase [Enterococcus faecium]|nr:glycosyltransferase [Enterococcus faecium]GER77358.1 glycosyltransferase [Enterococcus sp. FM11-1]
MYMEKVAIITSGYLPIPSVMGGGVEVLIDNLIIQNESEKKVKFTIFSSHNSDAEKISSKYRYSEFFYLKTNQVVKGLDKFIYFIMKNIFKVNKPYSYRYIFQRLKFIRSVSKILKKNNYDKIIIENNAVLLGVLKNKNNYEKYKGKYYMHLHNEILNDFNNYSILKSVSKILCVSEYLSTITAAKFESLGKEKFEVVLNGIDLDRFRYIDSTHKIDDLKKKFSIKNNEFIFLYTGRIAEEKGILELLTAFSNIKNKNSRLLIVGSSFFDTNVKSKFERRIEHIIDGMKDRIIFTGYIPNNDLYEIYNIADVSVLPSIWGEPAGLTMVESICSGTPVITTNAGGIPEYIDEDCAIILQNDNKLTENLSKSMDYLINNIEVVEEMKGNSIKKRNIYGKEFYYKKFISAIN